MSIDQSVLEPGNKTRYYRATANILDVYASYNTVLNFMVLVYDPFSIIIYYTTIMP